MDTSNSEGNDPIQISSGVNKKMDMRSGNMGGSDPHSKAQANGASTGSSAHQRTTGSASGSIQMGAAAAGNQLTNGIQIGGHDPSPHSATETGNGAQSGVQVLKVQFNDDIKCVPILNLDITYTDFTFMLARLFGKKFVPEDIVALKYKDDDGDLITISDTSDLTFAIGNHHVLKVKIFLKSVPTTFTTEEERAFQSLAHIVNSQVNDLKGKLRELRDQVNGLLDLLDHGSSPGLYSTLSTATSGSGNVSARRDSPDGVDVKGKGASTTSTPGKVNKAEVKSDGASSSHVVHSEPQKDSSKGFGVETGKRNEGYAIPFQHVAQTQPQPQSQTTPVSAFNTPAIGRPVSAVNLDSIASFGQQSLPPPPTSSPQLPVTSIQNQNQQPAHINPTQHQMGPTPFSQQSQQPPTVAQQLPPPPQQQQQQTVQQQQQQPQAPPQQQPTQHSGLNYPPSSTPTGMSGQQQSMYGSGMFPPPTGGQSYSPKPGHFDPSAPGQNLLNNAYSGPPQQPMGIPSMTRPSTVPSMSTPSLSSSYMPQPNAYQHQANQQPLYPPPMGQGQGQGPQGMSMPPQNPQQQQGPPQGTSAPPPQAYGPPPTAAYGFPPQQIGGVTLSGNPYARPTSSTYKMLVESPGSININSEISIPCKPSRITILTERGDRPLESTDRRISHEGAPGDIHPLSPLPRPPVANTSIPAPIPRISNLPEPNLPADTASVDSPAVATNTATISNLCADQSSSDPNENPKTRFVLNPPSVHSFGKLSACLENIFKKLTDSEIEAGTKIITG